MPASDGFAAGHVVGGEFSCEAIGEHNKGPAIGDADSGDMAGDVSQRCGDAAEEIGLVQEGEDGVGAECFEEAAEFGDGEGCRECGGIECGDGYVVCFKLGGERAGVSKADGVNVPCFGLQAAGDADEGFFGTAFVEFGDDHHE